LVLLPLLDLMLRQLLAMPPLREAERHAIVRNEKSDLQSIV
jgi:hypothetical protein